MSVSERRVEAGVLSVCYLESGPPDGWPCILMHGFPYDAHAYDEAAALLSAQGARVLVPWMRGYGRTHFLSSETMRSGEQAAFGADLLAFMDALSIDRAVLAGYDWGGRAACVVSALWPERVEALVSGNTYNIQHIGRSWEPADPRTEARFWYQYYFHSERGKRGLTADRRPIARYLWKTWSPNWAFDDETFERSATAWDNADFVDVVIHSYRHRFALIYGDDTYQDVETRLAHQPVITVPTIGIDGSADGVGTGTAHHKRKFAGPFAYRVFEGAGHNLPQERPEAWVEAVLDARAMAG